MIQKTYQLLTSLTILLLVTVPPTTSEGLSCHGNNHYCKGWSSVGGFKNDHELLQTSLNEIPDTSTYQNGKNIACLPGGSGGGIDGALCVWVWNTQNTTTGARVKQLYQRILDHGCKVCGSAPTEESGNDVSTGEVTIGFSFNEGACDGVCNEYGGSDYLPGAFVPSTGGPPAAATPHKKQKRSRGLGVK